MAASRLPKGVEILPATGRDMIELSSGIRDVERDEVQASTGLELLSVLARGLADSEEVWALRFDGALAGVWGVVPRIDSAITGKCGYGWLLTTDLVDEKPITFWKTCIAVIPALLNRWDELVNAIDVRHEKALRWASRLGFQLEDPAPYGAMGLPFQVFRVRKRDLLYPQQRQGETTCALRP